MSDGAGPVAAFPNPGLPQLVGGQIRFSRDVDHFAGYGVKLAEAGARLIGGCCGTTPDHVRALTRAHVLALGRTAALSLSHTNPTFGEAIRRLPRPAPLAD